MSILPLQVRGITSATAVLLFNVQSRLLIGVFAPTGQPGYDLEPAAFGGGFPAQLRVAPRGPLRCVSLQVLTAQRCCTDEREPSRMATGLLHPRAVEHLMDVMLRFGEPFPPPVYR
jgi:hypothetical protein